MKLGIPQLEIESASADELVTGPVTVGPIQIDSVVADAARVGLTAASIAFTGATATVSATVELRLGLGVPKPDGGEWSDSWKAGKTDTAHLFSNLDGHFSPDEIDDGAKRLHRLLAIRPDLPIPQLRVAHEGWTPSLSFSATDVTLGAVTLTPPPELAGRSASLTGHTLTTVSAPGLPLPIAGFGVDRLTAEGLSLPLASLDTWEIERVSATVAGDVSRTNAEVDLVENGSLRLKNLSISLDSSSFGDLPSIDASFHGVGGSVSMSLSVTASLTFDTLSITGIGLAVGFDALQLRGLSVPVEIVRLALSRLGLRKIGAARVELTP
jgi:hypothetical protein